MFILKINKYTILWNTWYLNNKYKISNEKKKNKITFALANDKW